jgi:hypothetical protein
VFINLHSLVSWHPRKVRLAADTTLAWPLQSRRLCCCTKITELSDSAWVPSRCRVPGGQRNPSSHTMLRERRQETFLVGRLTSSQPWNRCPFWSKGYATAAVQGAISYARNKLKVRPAQKTAGTSSMPHCHSETDKNKARQQQPGAKPLKELPAIARLLPIRRRILRVPSLGRQVNWDVKNQGGD